MAADLRDEYGNPVQPTDQYGNPVQLTDEHGNPMHLYGIATLPAKNVWTIAYGDASGSGVKTDTPYGTAPGSGITTTSTGTHHVGYNGTPTGGSPGSGLRTDTPYGTALGSGITTGGTGIHDVGVTASGIMSGQGMYGAVPSSHTTNQHQPEGPREIQHSSNSSSSSSEDDGQGGRRKKKGLKQKINEKLTGKDGDHDTQSHSDTTSITKTATSTAEAYAADQHHNGHEKKSFLEKIKEKLPGHHYKLVFFVLITVRVCGFMCTKYILNKKSHKL